MATRTRSGAAEGRADPGNVPDGVVRCEKCDKTGHNAQHCPEYPERRGMLQWCVHAEHPDAVQPSPTELKCKRAGSVPDVVIQASVKRIDGSGLICFYLMVIAGLVRLPRVRDRPTNVNELVQQLSSFFKGARAGAIKQTLSGHTLQEICQEHHMTWHVCASRLLYCHTFREMCAVAWCCNVEFIKSYS
jgi:hypothetical protein